MSNDVFPNLIHDHLGRFPVAEQAEHHVAQGINPPLYCIKIQVKSKHLKMHERAS